MTAVVLAFVAGVLLLQLQGGLPSLAWLIAVPACLALGVWRRGLRLPAAFALGFLWAAGCAQLRLADRLAPELEGRDLQVTGVVSGLPAAGGRSLRFDFEPESAPSGVTLPRRLRLAWYARPAPASAPELHPGERWRFTVRLRRPHGQVNPYGFDYEAWLLERGIGATGYVRALAAPQRLGARGGALDRIGRAREAVRDRFLGVLGPTPAAGVLAALAVGDQHAISNEEWRLFQRTGVTHLMSISGATARHTDLPIRRSWSPGGEGGRPCRARPVSPRPSWRRSAPPWRPATGRWRCVLQHDSKTSENSATQF